ncbi:hypothetical protein HUO13_22185 [Saccharopolyspora erythraea]|nr:hypothetical protein HUO13_22185 [Saccharopolyspora erythraea]
MKSDIERQREEWESRYMTEVPSERTWRVPAYADKGPVTITLRYPEVRIVDSEGREIAITPQQADLVGSKLGGISDWLQFGHGDWVAED